MRIDCLYSRIYPQKITIWASPDVALDASKSDHCGVPSSVADTLLEVLLVSELPLDQSQIARAAEEMTAEHGNEALTKANERFKELQSEGFDSVAQTWEMICDAVENIQTVNPDAGVSTKIMIDDKLPEGYVILCKAKDEDHTFLVRRLGPSVECPRCGSTALSADLTLEFGLRNHSGIL